MRNTCLPIEPHGGLEPPMYPAYVLENYSPVSYLVNDFGTNSNVCVNTLQYLVLDFISWNVPQMSLTTQRLCVVS